MVYHDELYNFPVFSSGYSELDSSEGVGGFPSEPDEWGSFLLEEYFGESHSFECVVKEDISRATGVDHYSRQFRTTDVELYHESVVVWLVEICGLIFVKGGFVVGT